MPGETKSVLIIGAGVIGLSVGWELARAGVEVTIFEEGRAGGGTSWQAAGMLAPDAEIGFEELELYRFSLESRKRWPAFARALEEASGIDVDLRTEGTLLVADDRDSAEALRRRFKFQQEHGCRVQWLTGAEALSREPFLAPRLSAAVYAPDDYQVDNRRVIEALRVAFEKAGGVLKEETAVTYVHGNSTEPTIETDGGYQFSGSHVIVASGVRTSQITGLLGGLPPIRPVKGQVIELRSQLPFALQHVVRGPDAYVVPKSDGRVIVGATSEERGFDTDVTAGGLFELLEGAWEVVPGIYDLPVNDMWAGLRPASFDHSPLLGSGPAPGVIYATGHYRHGILLAPITAQELARLVTTGETSSWIEPFAPSRFTE